MGAPSRASASRSFAAASLGVLLAASFLPLSPPAVAAPAPSPLSVAEIVRRSVSVNAADWKAQVQYSLRQEQIKGKENAEGQLSNREDKSYQVTMIEGTPYLRLIEINHEPLSPAQAKEEDAKMQREIAARKAESPEERRKRLAKYASERSEEKLLMEQMATAFHFTLQGEQMVEGVPCYVLDAMPDPNYKPPVQRARVLLGMKGRLFIDKVGFHWVRVQAQVTSPVEFGFFLARVKPGTSFLVEQARVGAVWLPKHFVQSVNATVLGVYGMRNKEEDFYSDYKLLPDTKNAHHLVASR